MRGRRRGVHPGAAHVQRWSGVTHAYYWTAFDNEFFNRTVSVANRLGVLRRFQKPGGGRRLANVIARGKSSPAGIEERVALTAEAHNTIICLEVPSDYTGTAMAAVAMARELYARKSLDYGVTFPFDLFTLEQIVSRIDSPEVRVEFYNSHTDHAGFVALRITSSSITALPLIDNRNRTVSATSSGEICSAVSMSGRAAQIAASPAG